MLVLVKRGKQEYPEETFSQQRKDQQQTQPIYGVDAGIWTRATLEGNKSKHRMESQAVSIAKPSVCSFITITRNKLGGGEGVEVDRGRGSANSLESDNGVSF